MSGGQVLEGSGSNPFTQIGTAGNSYSDSGLRSATSSGCHVATYDGAGNTSTKSATASASSQSSIPLNVPSVYADLYSQLSQDLDHFDAATTAQWNGSTFSVNYAGELSAVNPNQSSTTLPSMNRVNQQILELKAIGVKTIAIEVSFPMLYQPFFHSFVPNGDALYMQWVSFYQTVANSIRAQGLKVAIESETLIPTAMGNGGNPPAWAPYLSGPNGFYTSLNGTGSLPANWTQYQAARADAAATVAQTIKPDYFNVQTEPGTEATQTGQSNVFTADGSTSMFNQILAAIRATNSISPLTGLQVKVGAGVGSWEINSGTGHPLFQDFVNSYTQQPLYCASHSCVTSKPDYFDVHIFPVNEAAPNNAPINTNFWQNALNIIEQCKAAGMPTAMGQTWLRKVRDSEWAPGPSQIPGDVQEARETYDFWTPLDQHMIQILYKLANFGQMDYINPFNTQNWTAYQPWNSSTSLSYDGGNNPSGQVFSAEFTLAFLNLQSASYTATAQTYHDLIVAPGDASAPSIPANLTATMTGPTSVTLGWNLSTDNVGVAGYHIWRNGTALPDTFVASFSDSALTVGATYSYQVAAFDLAGNVSSPTTVNVTVSSSNPPVVQFSASSYFVSEGSGGVTITVNRTGDTSGTSTVDYRTTDTDTFTVNCSDKHGNAFGRCDFATVVGTFTFAAGETTKTFLVPIINDGYAEGDETFSVVLSNPMGATLGNPSTATVTINDNETTDQPNPILQTNTTGVDFFVRQHYLDFLGREPEPSQPWSGILNGCANQFNTDPNSPSANCDRITVSGDFFGSPEFKTKGFFVIDFYRVAFNRLPTYVEFSTDLASVVGTTAQETLAKRAAYATNFVARTEFTGFYNPNTMTNSQFVNALMSGDTNQGGRGQNYNLASIRTPNPASPDDTSDGNKVVLTTNDLINGLNGMTLTKAQVLRAIVQSDEISLQKEAVNAFVASQYYGYLRRTPDQAGFDSWKTFLTNNPNDFRTMVNGFLNSTEYRLRFGP